jgi:tRNA-specific 2-thiouridylase
VVDIRPGPRTVVVGRKEDILVDACRVEAVSFVSGRPPQRPDVEVRVRYRSRPVPARLEPAGGEWLAWFEEPQAAVAPGQAAVFSRGEEVLGGGTIAALTRR